MAVLSGALLSSEAAKARVNELPTQCPRSFNALAQHGDGLFARPTKTTMLSRLCSLLNTSAFEIYHQEHIDKSAAKLTD